MAAGAAEAESCRLPVYSVLHATGRVTHETYAAAFAESLGLPFASWQIDLRLRPRQAQQIIAQSASLDPLPIRWRGGDAVIVSATRSNPAELTAFITALRIAGHHVVVAPQICIDAALQQRAAALVLDDATTGLARAQPEVSAARAGPVWQPALGAIAVGLLSGGIVIDPRQTFAIVATALTVFFIGVVSVRVVALACLLWVPSAKKPVPRLPDADLPIYTVMVPLYDEARVIPKLVASLSRLDYPPAKLDVMIVIEAVDVVTLGALLKATLPANMRVIVVPDGQPRTKPKALNYALAFARGQYVVVYDAEDRPERGQLREALNEFNTGGDGLACVQARLNIYNSRQSWLTRQFAIEYSALFDAVLPALGRMGIPVPLGGTSNHFPRAVLEELGGWDPYNVTEDADLGIRIARLRYRTTTIPSTTWEEAPALMKPWRTQRTRWLKGWMQTILVHTRDHRALRRELGFFRTIGFHLYMTGLVVSALVHPFFYMTVAAEMMTGRSIGLEPLLGPAFWGVAIATLVTGYAASIATAWIAARRRSHSIGLGPLLMPFYWLLISAMSYRALWQLIRDPFRWEKTPHGHAKEDRVYRDRMAKRGGH